MIESNEDLENRSKPLHVNSIDEYCLYQNRKSRCKTLNIHLVTAESKKYPQIKNQF
jgi:hypothetical protein